MCCILLYSLTVCAVAVSEIDTAPGEVVRSLTPGVVRRVWSIVQSAPARPWWAASLPKGQNEGAVLGQRYVVRV